MDEQESGGSGPLSACYGYDGNGNRLWRIVNSLTPKATGSSYDSQNRLLAETLYGDLESVPNPVVSVSSTASGYSVAALTDRDVPDTMAPTRTWASEVLAGTQHAVTFSYASAQPVSKVALWMPTVDGLASRFKAQYWDGNAYQDLPQAEVAGAEPSPTQGWYAQTAHEIVFSCFLVNTSQVRFLQDAGGGAPLHPDQAALNEMQAYAWANAEVRTMGYDPAGLLMSESSSSGTTSYGYDWGYRLKSWESGNKVVSYASDVLGRRMSRTVQVGGSDPVTERYVYDGEDVLADVGEGTSGAYYAAVYTNGLGIDEKLSMMRDGAVYGYVPDALGGTHELLNAAQAVSNRYVTDAWGVGLQKVEAVANRYQYTGREFDNDTGKYHFRHRTQDPNRGIFFQRDPIRRHGTGNDRGYAGGNPVNFTDPYGLYEYIIVVGSPGPLGGMLENAAHQREQEIRSRTTFDTKRDKVTYFMHSSKAPVDKNAILEYLQKQRKEEDRIVSLDFFAHGAPGTVSLLTTAEAAGDVEKNERGHLRVADIENLSQEAIARIRGSFTPDAQATIWGCFHDEQVRQNVKRAKTAQELRAIAKTGVGQALATVLQRSVFAAPPGVGTEAVIPPNGGVDKPGTEGRRGWHVNREKWGADLAVWEQHGFFINSAGYMRHDPILNPQEEP